MPELPEVESVRRQLAPLVEGRTVRAVARDPYPSRRMGDVARAVGGTLGPLGRRGKFLLAPLSGPAPHPSELVLHLGMTGILRVLPIDEPAGRPGGPDPHVRVRMELDDGTALVLRDARRFGRVDVVDPGDRTRLLDQRLVAGVGNIYADEALWRSRVHPAARRVTRPAALRLHAAIREVLAAAVAREGTTFRDYQLVNGASGRYLTELDAYGRGGQPCRRCGTTLRSTTIAQRGTVHCPRCQRA